MTWKFKLPAHCLIEGIKRVCARRLPGPDEPGVPENRPSFPFPELPPSLGRGLHRPQHTVEP